MEFGVSELNCVIITLLDFLTQLSTCEIEPKNAMIANVSVKVGLLVTDSSEF